MTDFNSNSAPEADTFYDMQEVREAMADPLYKTSARYRDGIAVKLTRSQEAGTIGRLSERITSGQRVRSRTAYNDDANSAGFIQPGANPNWAEAGKVTMGVFKSSEEVATAFGAPAFEIDPTYQDAVREKIARSIREGFLTADLQPVKRDQ